MNAIPDIQTFEINQDKIMFVFSDFAAQMVSKTIEDKTTNLKDPKNTNSVSTGVIYAGDDNLFLNNLKKVAMSNYRLQKNVELSSIELASLGLQTGKISVGQNGEEVFTFVRNQDWVNFNRKWNLNINYLTLAARNFSQFYFSPVEVVLNEDKSKIIQVESKEAWLFRFAEPNEAGQITHCYLSAYWEQGVNIADEDETKIKKLPLIWRAYDTVDTIKQRAKDEGETNFIVLLDYKTQELFYPVPDWYPIITQGILDISNDATKYKKYILKNIVGVSIIVYVADWYWEAKYSDWKSLTQKFAKGGEEGAKAKAELMKYRQEVCDSVTSLFSRAENAGRILISDLKTSIKDEKLAKAITIETIDKKSFSGDHLPDQQEADSQIDWSTSIDTSRYGSKPGATNNSGNAKHNAQNIGQMIHFLKEELILEIPRIIRDYNGFDSELEFQIRRTTMLTQDAISPADRAIQKQ